MRKRSTAPGSRGWTCRWWDGDRAQSRPGHARRASRDLGRGAGDAGLRRLVRDRRAPPPASARSSRAGAPSTESIPASDCSPRPGYRATGWPSFSATWSCRTAAGWGTISSRPVVRLAMATKVIGLARGHSGVRREVVERLLALLEADALPCLPSQGSVGASGDLAPLGHLSAAMLGEGRIDAQGHDHARRARRCASSGWSRWRSGRRKGWR